MRSVWPNPIWCAPNPAIWEILDLPPTVDLPTEENETKSWEIVIIHDKVRNCEIPRDTEDKSRVFIVLYIDLNQSTAPMYEEW